MNYLTIHDNETATKLHVPQEFVSLLPAAVVNSHLIAELGLTEKAASDIEKYWHPLTADAVFDLGVRSSPSRLENLFLAADCLEEFGEETLRRTPGFFFFTRAAGPCDCLQFSHCCVCDLKTWIIDVDARHSARGLLIPRRNAIGWVSDFQVYRNAADPRPFPLRVRQGGGAA